MKIFIVLVLFGTTISFCQKREYYTNLDADNIIDSLIIYSENENLFIECNGSIIDLGAVSLFPIIRTDSNTTVDLLFVDLNNDGNKEIVLSTDHPVFANRAVLYFLNYKDSYLQKMEIGFGYNDIFDHLILFDNYVFYSDNNFYCKIGNIGFPSTSGETIFFDKVVLIKWDLNTGYLIKAGEKYFLKAKDLEKKEIVF
jgi:hypothetical protein